MQKLINNKKIIFFYAILLGVTSSFSLPPYGYFFINFITLNLLFILLNNNKYLYNKKDFFLYGWSFGFGYFFSSLYWITISLTFDPDFKFLIPLALILIPGFLAIFFAVPTFVLFFFKTFSKIRLILIFSLLFGISEYLRGTILTGFPWNLFIYSFSNYLSFLQALSLFGTYGLNLICITFFLIPSILFYKKTSFETMIAIILSIIFILFFLFGNYKLNISKSDNILINEEFNLKVLASKIDINRFYNIENEKELVAQLIDLGNKSDNNLPTIFIWPEGVLTASFLKDIKKYKDLFKSNFNKDDLIILGINDIQNDKETKIFNSLVVLDKELNIISVYHKNKLVPFGEFLPFENILSKLGLKKITNHYQSFSRGIERNDIKIKNLKILPLICYEIIYSGELSNHNNYDLIINISEDGWFGKSIGPRQHFVHSIFRAIEEGKNIIRSSNNGITAFVNFKGEIIKSSESTKSSVIEISYLKKPTKNTFFSEHKNNIFFYLIAIYISFIFFLKRIGR